MYTSVTQGARRFFRAVSLPRKISGEKGYLLIWSIIFMTFGTMVTAGLVTLVGVNLRGTGQAMDNAGEYYTADAGTSAVVADAMLGKDIAAPSYLIPEVALNNRTADIVINTPVPGSGSADVYHYFDPGVSGGLSSVAGRAHYTFPIDNVLARSALQVNWAFTPGGNNWDMTVYEGAGTGGAVVAKGKGKASPGSLHISAGQLAGGTYTVDFQNASPSPAASAPYSAGGGLGYTWVYTQAKKDYRIVSVSGYVLLDAYVRQEPGPSLPPLATPLVSIVSWQTSAPTPTPAPTPPPPTPTPTPTPTPAPSPTPTATPTATPTPVPFLFASGAYSGNGADNRPITGVGFQPDVVIVKGDTKEVAVLRTSTMSGDSTKPLVGAKGLTANMVQSLNADGFTLGTHATVNKNGITYYWMAWKAGEGSLRVGSYTGNGNSQSIAGLGFSPAYVIAMSAASREAVQRSSPMPTTFFFDSDTGAANRITSLNADGFTVGDSARVNTSGTTYYYVAWKAAAGRMNVGSYIGDKADNRSIAGVGFAPDYVIIRPDATAPNKNSSHKSTATGPTTDLSMDFHASANSSNHIQALEGDGFQVGSDNQVNHDGNTLYYWMAFTGSGP